jgi:hypothetical protein
MAAAEQALGLHPCMIDADADEPPPAITWSTAWAAALPQARPLRLALEEAVGRPPSRLD